ncbi:hypothetical protein V6N13_029656 [Hibiscus sabdariffa]
MEDAIKAQERLDRFHIYGSRVRVHLSQNKDLWRKKIDEPDNRRADENSDLLWRVSGVLDSEKMTILNNCLIGLCNEFMCTDILAKELHNQGITRTSMENFRKKTRRSFREMVQ